MSPLGIAFMLGTAVGVYVTRIVTGFKRGVDDAFHKRMLEDEQRWWRERIEMRRRCRARRGRRQL